MQESELAHCQHHAVCRSGFERSAAPCTCGPSSVFNRRGGTSSLKGRPGTRDQADPVDLLTPPTLYCLQGEQINPARLERVAQFLCSPKIQSVRMHPWELIRSNSSRKLRCKHLHEHKQGHSCARVRRLVPSSFAKSALVPWVAATPPVGGADFSRCVLCGAPMRQGDYGARLFASFARGPRGPNQTP